MLERLHPGVRAVPVPRTLCETRPRAVSPLRQSAWRLLAVHFALACSGAAASACGPEPPAPATRHRPGWPFRAYCTAPVEDVGTVNVEDDYLPRVVQCENGGAPYAALQAQAVAARTYLYYKLETAGVIKDGQIDQVYSCAFAPSLGAIQAVRETSGQVISYRGQIACAFYVAGSKQQGPSCLGSTAHVTEQFVTYNWGLNGSTLRQSPLGWVDASNTRNRGCMSQWGARCLADAGWRYDDILRFYYGMDITIENAIGPCVASAARVPHGAVESVSCDGLRGWAFDPDTPDEPVYVQLWLDGPPGSPTASTFIVRADEPRDALCDKLGSCDHGLSAALPAGVRDGAEHSVWALALDTQHRQDQPLDVASARFRCEPPPPPPQLLPSRAIRRAVQDPDSINAWRFSLLHDVVVYSPAELEEYEVGPPLPARPSLVEASEEPGERWLVDGAVRRPIDESALTAWHLDAADMRRVSYAELAALPTAAPLPPRPVLVRASGSTLFLLDVPIASP